MIIDRHSPENFSAVDWLGSDREKNLGLVHKSKFWTNYKIAEHLHTGNSIRDIYFVLIKSRIPII